MLQELAVNRQSWCLSRAISNSRTAWQQRSGVRVGCRAGDDWGWGEASPLPGYSTETEAQVFSHLSQLSPSDFGPTEFFSWPAIVERVRSLVPSTLPSARYALECALLELASKRKAKPMVRFLNPDPDPGPRPMAELMTSLATGEEEANSAVKRGAASIKLKIGHPGLRNRELVLAQIISQRHSHVRLRLDANQALAAEDVQAYFSDWTEVPVEFVEEPSADWEGFSPTSLSMPLAMDESLRRPDAVELLETWASKLGALVLKPAVLGGLSKALEWAKLGQKYGVPSVVSHLLDGPTAAVGLRTLVRALPARGPAHGLGLQRAQGLARSPQPRSQSLILADGVE